MRTFKVQLSEKRWGEGSCYSLCVSRHYVSEPPRKFMSLCFNGDTKNLNQVYTADNWHRQVSNQAWLLFFVLCPQPSGGSHYRSGRQTVFIMLDAIILQIYLEPGFLSFFFFLEMVILKISWNDYLFGPGHVAWHKGSPGKLPVTELMVCIIAKFLWAKFITLCAPSKECFLLIFMKSWILWMSHSLRPGNRLREQGTKRPSSIGRWQKCALRLGPTLAPALCDLMCPPSLWGH